MAAASPTREAPAQVMLAAQQALTAGGRGAGPALTEDELLMACGAFNPDKYDEYNRQVGEVWGVQHDRWEKCGGQQHLGG